MKKSIFLLFALAIIVVWTSCLPDGGGQPSAYYSPTATNAARLSKVSVAVGIKTMADKASATPMLQFAYDNPSVGKTTITRPDRQGSFIFDKLNGFHANPYEMPFDYTYNYFTSYGSSSGQISSEFKVNNTLNWDFKYNFFAPGVEVDAPNKFKQTFTGKEIVIVPSGGPKYSYSSHEFVYSYGVSSDKNQITQVLISSHNKRWYDPTLTGVVPQDGSFRTVVVYGYNPDINKNATRNTLFIANSFILSHIKHKELYPTTIQNGIFNSETWDLLLGKKPTMTPSLIPTINGIIPTPALPGADYYNGALVPYCYLKYFDIDFQYQTSRSPVSVINYLFDENYQNADGTKSTVVSGVVLNTGSEIKTYFFDYVN